MDFMFVSAWGGRGRRNGKFNNPAAVAIANDGSVYVVDEANHRIQQFDGSGKFIRKWGQLGEDQGEFRRPSGISIATNQGISFFVLDALHQTSKWSALPPGLLPICAAYIGEERILVADAGNRRIQIFHLDGTFICQYGDVTYFVERGWMDQNGMLYIADCQFQHIRKYGKDGKLRDRWSGIQSSGAGQPYGAPSGGGVDNQGNIYIVTSHFGRRSSLRALQPDGTLIRQWPIEFCNYRHRPVCVHKYTIYIGYRNSVRVYRTDGTYIGRWGNQGKADGQFMDIQGLCMSNAGILYVVDRGSDRIVRVNIQGSHRDNVQPNSPADAQIVEPDVQRNHESNIIAIGWLIYLVITVFWLMFVV